MPAIRSSSGSISSIRSGGITTGNPAGRLDRPQVGQPERHLVARRLALGRRLDGFRPPHLRGRDADQRPIPGPAGVQLPETLSVQRTHVSFAPPPRPLLTTISPSARANLVRPPAATVTNSPSVIDERSQVDVTARDLPVDHRRVDRQRDRLLSDEPVRSLQYLGDLPLPLRRRSRAARSGRPGRRSRIAA